MKIAISGASGKTGYRIAEEAKKLGLHVRLLIRSNSILPDSLKQDESVTFSLNDPESIDKSLLDIDALIIATGARPNIDLTGPARIDACGVRNQINSCKRSGIKRVILVSSLCAGRFFHPLNLFGFILLWKRIGEKSLEYSDLDWTVIRPGGLNENEEDLKSQGILFTSKDRQEEGSIPRRLVAQACLEALNCESSIGKIIEITSNENTKQQSLKNSIESFKLKTV